MSRRAPFGLRRRGGKLVPDLVEAAIVREVAEAFVRADGRLKTAAADLNARGLRTRQDAKWSDTAVRRALRVVSNDGVLPDDLRDRCLALLQRRESASETGGRRSAHPLGGAVECACGAKMYVEDSGGPKFVCRGCRRKIPVDTLERLLVESLASVEVPAAEVVEAIADDPRAAELTRILGGRPVPVSAAWPALKDPERRILVENAVARVVVDDDRATVYFALQPDSEPNSGSFSDEPLPSPDDSEPRREMATDDPDARAKGSREDLPLLLPVETAAELLHATPKAVYAMVERGLVPGVVRVGRRLLFRRDELLDSLGGSRASSPKEVRR